MTAPHLAEEGAAKQPDGAQPAPIFGTWRNAYIAIVLAFILQVAIFYAFGRYFS